MNHASGRPSQPPRPRSQSCVTATTRAQRAVGEWLQGTHGPNKAPASSRGHAGDTHGTPDTSSQHGTIPAHPLPPRAESRCPTVGVILLWRLREAGPGKGTGVPREGGREAAGHTSKGTEPSCLSGQQPKIQPGLRFCLGGRGEAGKGPWWGAAGREERACQGYTCARPATKCPVLPCTVGPHHSRRGPRARPSSHRHPATAWRGQPCQPSCPPPGGGP